MENQESLQSSITSNLIPSPGQELLTNPLLSFIPDSTQPTGLSDPTSELVLLPVELTTPFISTQTPQESQLSLSLVDPLLTDFLGVNVNPIFDTGVFTVGAKGEVGFDFLLDGGAYEGELAIFNLEGMDTFELGSEAFIQEAARRALSDSSLGHVVISDFTEGARFQGLLGESNQNSGIYQGVKTFSMRPGDEFALLIVPKGTVQQVFNNPFVSGAMRPLFSLSTANPNDAFQVGQIADVTGDGSTFVMEDLRVDSWSDKDYNDFIFQVRGATGTAARLDEVIDPAKDWRSTDLGQALIEYTKPYVTPDNPSVGEVVSDDLIDVVFGNDNNSDVEVDDSSAIVPTTEANSQPTVAETVASQEMDAIAPSTKDNNFASTAESTGQESVVLRNTLIDNWLEQVNEKLETVRNQGSENLSSLANELSQAENGAYNQMYDLWNNLSNNQNYLNSWTNYTNSEISNASYYMNAWVENLGSELSNTGSYMYDQQYEAGNQIGSNTNYMDAWVNYLGNQVSNAQSNMSYWTNNLWNQLVNKQDQMYAWANYLSDQISSQGDYMYEWLDWVWENFNDNNVGDDGWNRYNQLGDYTEAALNDAWSAYNDLASYSNQILNNAWGEYNAIYNYAQTEIGNAWSNYNAVNNYTDAVKNWAWNQYNALNDYRLSVMGDAWNNYYNLNNYANIVINDAWNQYNALVDFKNATMDDAWSEFVALDEQHHQTMNAAWNQYGNLSNSWNDWAEDTQAQIDVWAKIAKSENIWNDTPNDSLKSIPLVGIIDTGFSADNPDIDYSRITLGKDWVDGDYNPLLQPGEGNEHGTQMLEIVAATRNNDIGINGINDKSPLWLGRAVGSNDWAQSLIEYVDTVKESNNPNAIVNLSFDLTQTNADGSATTRSELTSLERAALTYAQQNHVLIVAATGNQGITMSALGQAVKEFDNIFVAGAAEDWQRVDYSSYGEVDYDYYGKGVDILAQGDATNGASGTSVAAAKITGAASLVWAANPSLNYTQVMDILRRTATDLNTHGWDAKTGLGLLNIAAAVHLAKATEPEAYSPPALALVQDTLKDFNIPEVYWPEFYQLYHHYDLEAKLNGPSWSGIGEIATERAAGWLDDAVDWAEDKVSDATDYVSDHWDWERAGKGALIGVAVGGLGGATLGAIIGGLTGGSASSFVKQVVTDSVTAIAQSATDLGKKIDEAVDVAVDTATDVGHAIKDTVDGVVDSVNNVGTAINSSVDAVVDTASNIGDAIAETGNKLEQAADYVGNRVNAAHNAVIDAAIGVGNTLKDAGNTISDAASFVGDRLNEAADTINQVADFVGDRIPTSIDDLKQLSGDFKDFLNENNPVKKLADDLGAKLQSTLDGVDVGAVLDVLKRIPVVGTAVSGLEGLYYLAQGDWIEVLKAAINGALGFYGASNVVTPRMVSLFVDVAWELKDQDYKGAIAAALSNFNVERQLADTFVNVAWAMKDGQWEDVLSAGLSSAGFNNANQFVDIAWGVIDGNYQDALTTGLQVAGLDKLGIDESEAAAFVNSALALRDGDTNEVAEQLLSVAGDNAQQFANSSWVRALRDTNPNNDRVALSQGLSAIGFQNITQWVDMAWDIKDKQYLDALSTGFSLGGFIEGKNWVDMARDLQQENYLDALSTGFKIAGFDKGEHLAKAAIALREGNPINAFYEGLSLVDGVGELVDAFKYLKDGNAKQAVPLMIQAAPKVAILIGT